jgi:riboflavin transporter FmnP
LSKRGLQVLAGVVLAAALAIAGYWLLFTTFMVYDDEGYVLLSLKNFAAHGALYDKVYTQYGPFFYVAYDALHRLLGFAWTNTAGRWITLVNWWGTAAVCALLVGRLTRSALLTAFTGVGVFTYLWVMINEPMHPGGLLGLSVALAAWLGAEAIISRRMLVFAAVTGTIGAAVVLTKINVGVFLLLAAFAWLLLHTPMAARWARWALALLFVALPFALMHTLFDAAWVRLFALVFGTSMLAVLIGGRPDEPSANGRAWLAFLGAGALTTAVICGLALARGTSLHGLLAGVLLDPLRHPSVYFFAFNWRTGAVPALLAGLTVCLLFDRFGDRAGFRRTIAGIRLGLLGVTMLSSLTVISPSLAAFGMSYGVGLAGLLVLPLRRDRLASVRLWLALLLVLQLLHAYPIAGSQLNWGTFLWIPLLVLGVDEAIEVIVEWKGTRSWPVRGIVQGIMVAVAVFMVGQLARIGWINRHSGEPLQLPGAENIVLPDDTAFALRIITENARQHGDMLFSLPGVYSLNLWSGLPTPTLANATHWFSLLSSGQQLSIIARLQADPRPVLIVQRDTLYYLARYGFRASGPLVEFLGRDFERAFEVDDYAFWVRRGRTIAPLSTGRIASDPAHPGEHRLELVLAVPRAAVVSLELWTVGTPVRVHRLTLTAANARLEFTPLQDTGTPIGVPQLAAWGSPLPPSGIVKLTAFFNGEVGPPDKLLAFVLDAEGHRLAAARALH